MPRKKKGRPDVFTKEHIQHLRPEGQYEGLTLCGIPEDKLGRGSSWKEYWSFPSQLINEHVQEMTNCPTCFELLPVILLSE